MNKMFESRWTRLCLVMFMVSSFAAQQADADQPNVVSTETAAPVESSATETHVIDIMDDLDSTNQLLDETIISLQEGHVDKSIATYQQAVVALVDVSVAIRNHARQAGQSLVKVDFALSHLDEMLVDVDPKVSPEWLSEFSRQRTKYLNEVNCFARCQSETSAVSMKQAILAQQKAASVRLKMLDQWLQPSGTMPANNADALKLAFQGLTLQKNRLISDVELLALAGNALSQKIAFAQRDVDRNIRLMTVQLQLPRQMEQQMASTSKVVRQTLKSSLASQRSSRATARKTALKLVSSNTPVTVSLVNTPAGTRN